MGIQKDKKIKIGFSITKGGVAEFDTAEEAELFEKKIKENDFDSLEFLVFTYFEGITWNE